MARAITREDSLPPYAQAYVARIRAFGFGWAFAEEHPLVPTGKRIQVRDSEYLAPPKEVTRYEQALRKGDQMPPVIVTADGYLVDGATRTEAARKVGWNHYPAFRLDVAFENATAPQRRELMALGAGFNLTHGRGMNTANIARIIADVMEDDDSPKDIAKKLHIPESTANTLVNAARARRQASRLGVELTGTLSNTHLRIFGAKYHQYTEPVWAEFLSLAQDARLTIAAIMDLSRRLDATGTERGRMDLLDTERVILRDRINGAAVSSSKAAKLRQSLGYLLVQDAESLAEREPSAASTHVTTLREAARQLANVIEAQERVERSRAGD